MLKHYFYWLLINLINFKHLLVTGLRHLDTKDSTELAFQWAEKWVYTNYLAYRRTNSMFEKVKLLKQLIMINIHNKYLEYSTRLLKLVLVAAEENTKFRSVSDGPMV